jgi:predicted dehydrogenase
MKVIKTAVVGYGKSAKIFHLPYLLSIPDFEIKAFVSSQVDDNQLKSN